MKELVNKIYELKQKQAEKQAQVDALNDEIAALNKELEPLQAELLGKVVNDPEFNGKFRFEDNGVVAEYFKKETVGYANESEVINFLKARGYTNFINVKESLKKKELKAEFKKAPSLEEQLKPFIKTSVSEYVVVTSAENSEKMHEHITETKKGNEVLNESK